MTSFQRFDARQERAQTLIMSVLLLRQSTDAIQRRSNALTHSRSGTCTVKRAASVCLIASRSAFGNCDCNLRNSFLCEHTNLINNIIFLSLVHGGSLAFTGVDGATGWSQTFMLLLKAERAR